jgi:hypothetical protein
MLNNIAAMLNGGAAAVGDYQSISTSTVGVGGVASVTFSSIPSTYKHLQVRCIARGTAVASYDYLRLRLNGATTGYSRHALLGNGTAASANGSASDTLIGMGEIPASTSTANAFGVAVIDLLDYANTTTNKTVRGLIGNDQSATSSVYLASGAIYSTSAISSITLYPDTTLFAQYSTFALYGIN